ncbi:MAG: nucleoside 2-deoxyribosyltransferase [Erysipelotrichaceae bacterium]|nr:nucleoside 2-deoxyribosyltransferase [Erysipelotrichaceae bacterium]
MNKKVYFAGSIRGGRQDEQLYRRIISHIKETDTVLTEHVGDLSLNSLEGVDNRDVRIYVQDTNWLRECDLVIAECTRPSLGVGYELAFAEKLNKPCYVFYRHSVSELSAMIKGDDYFQVYSYETFEEIKNNLDEILK